MQEQKYSLDRFADFADIIMNKIGAIESRLDVKEDEKYLTVREVMTLFSINKQSVYNWINNGHLIVHKKGVRTFFKKSEIDASMVELKKYKHN